MPEPDGIMGLMDENIRTDMSDMITELGREFTLDQFQEKLIEYGFSKERFSAEQIARDLFNASWIGNEWDTDKGTPRYSWKHRKINAKLNVKHKIVVHSGLWKTLNLI